MEYAEKKVLKEFKILIEKLNGILKSQSDKKRGRRW
jgi:hypothetical protein